MDAMEMIYPAATTKPARGPIVAGTLVGLVLLVGGLGLAWLAIATPLVRGLTPNTIRPAPEQMAVGAIIWGFSLVAPPSFAIVGLFRSSRGPRSVSPRRTADPTAEVPAASVRIAPSAPS